jgi:arylsulfatase
MKELLCFLTLLAMSSAAYAQDKPNMLIIWGDDIGQSNISAYTRGMMGYETPNIDRIANEGMIFTDYYGEQSCTAGRASYITGQSVYRTGLSKVGLPGAHAESAGICHRSVRQKPLWRPGQAFADESRIR